MDITPPQRQKTVSPIPRPPRQASREKVIRPHREKRSSIKPYVIVVSIIVLVAILGFASAVFFMSGSQNISLLGDIEPLDETSSSSPEPTPIPAESRVFDFHLTIPEDWEDHSHSFSHVDAMFVGPAPQRSSTGMQFLPNINVVRAALEEGRTFADHVVLSKQDLESSLPDFFLIDDARIVTLEGEPAHILGGTFTKDGVTIRMKQLHMFSLSGSYVFAVTASALAERWDEGNFNELYDSILVSFVPPFD